MTYLISVTDSDISFDCDEGETVLDAAERAGYAIPYSCRKGVCSSCEGGIRTGHAVVRGQGVCNGPIDGVFMCQARPRSDLEIVPQRIKKTEPVRRKLLDAKVRKITRPAPNVSVINMRFSVGIRAAFQAGQYLRILMPDGDSRNYSMANGPYRNDGAELHIRHVPGGKFSRTILAGLGPGDILQVELPFGNFTLSEQIEKTAILIATGTGFAPIKSIVEHQISVGGDRPLHLFWGATTKADIYMLELARKWASRHSWFTFTPVVSGPPDDWDGRTGLVHAAALADYPDMSDLEVYACGAPLMIGAAKRDFCGQSRLSEDDFFSDAFVASATPPDVPENQETTRT